MDFRIFRGATVLLFFLVGGSLFTPIHGSADEPGNDELGNTAMVSRQQLPPPPAKILPGRDCWNCRGPAASRPCLGSHSGYLYYGSRATDDDPVNGLSDCPRGDCGNFSAHLALSWIRFRPFHRKPARKHELNRGCPSCISVPHYFAPSPLQFPLGMAEKGVGDE